MLLSKIAWAITGSGHYIEECLDLVLRLKNVDVYIGQAGCEVLKMYGISIDTIRAKHTVYRVSSASCPPVGYFYQGRYHTFILAPATSNTIAKCTLGIADSLATNLYSQAGKCKIPSIVYPCDIAPQMETTAPGGKVMVYPRAVDLAATKTIETFTYTTVVRSVGELQNAVNCRIAEVQNSR